MGDHLLRQQDGWKVPTPTSASSPLELMIELMAAKPFIPKKLAERMGFESACKRKQKDLQSTDGTQSIRKYVLVHVN
jgi:hypothetical protein